MNRSKILFLTVTLSLIACDKGDAPKAASAEYKTAENKHDGKDGDTHEEGHEESELLKLSAQEIAAAEIKVSEVKPQDVAGNILVTATIEANQDRLAHVAPRIAGRIVKVNANLGDRVKPGQALALLDSLELGEARSAYLQAQSETALARTAFERAERLKGEQIIPEKDYLRA
ncbi:MAG: efflux RND transporter periplasmic adaptor subunit, partial [Burkholderiales bacterium]